MTDPVLDTVVVGAGHSGLGAGYYLKQSGRSYLILEKETIGDSWRSKRWDSFRLNTLNRLNELPGLTGHFSDPEGFCSGLEFVSYLVRYAKEFELPVIEQCTVQEINQTSDSTNFTIRVRQKGTVRQYHSRTVVIASGAQNMPMVPPFARDLPDGILQLHASEYVNPSSLPKGSVLVVGSAQSGMQVCEDLVAGGRKVFLSTSRVGRIPRRYRGKDVMEWLRMMGFFDQRPEDIQDPSMLHMTQPQVSGVGKRGSTVSLQALSEKGVSILGRMDSVNGGRVILQLNASGHVLFGDELSGRIKGMIEDYISKSGIEAPPGKTESADLPDPAATCATDIATLDLGENQITSVIWTTGFGGDFSYLDLPIFNDDGSPSHTNGVAHKEGIYFIGLPWMRKRKSALIHGAGEDAEFICRKVTEYLQK